MFSTRPSGDIGLYRKALGFPDGSLWLGRRGLVLQFPWLIVCSERLSVQNDSPLTKGLCVSDPTEVHEDLVASRRPRRVHCDCQKGMCLT